MPQSRLSRRIFTTPTFKTHVCVLLLSALAAPAVAVETWDGGGGDDNWSTDANWADDTAPAPPGALADGELLFTGSTRTNPFAEQAYSGITGITFNNAAAAFTLSGGTLSLDNGWINNNGPETQTIQNNLVASASSAALVLNADAGNLVLSGGIDLNATTGANLVVSGSANTTISGAISGTDGQITKTGEGTLTLSGTNTYTGSTTISGGTLILAGGNALPNTGAVVLDDTAGVTLQLNASETIGSLAGGGTTGGNVVLGASTLTVGNASNTTYAGSIIGTGGLTKQGSGTLTLSGANAYTGTTAINAGTLQVGGTAIVDSGAVVLQNTAGANLELLGDETIGSLAGGGAAGGNVLLNANTLTVGDATSTTYAGAISGTGGVTKQGTGTLTLSGTNTYTGDTTINEGTLAVSGGSAIADTGAVVLANVASAQLQLNADETIGSLSGGGTTGGTVLLGANTLTVGDASDTTYAGSLVGTGGLTKQGAGTLTLSGINLYTGTTTINAGTLAVSGGNAIVDTAAVDVNDAGASFQVDADETIGSLTGEGTVILSDDNTLTISGSDTATYDGTITGTGSLTKAGTGTQTLSGASDYSGGTTLTSGTLGVGDDSALGTGTLTINGGTIQASGDDHTLSNTVVVGGDFTVGNTGNTLTFANTVDLGTALRTITTTGDLTLDGVVSGTGGIAKQGAGTLTLNEANTYSGGTTLIAGTLALGNDEALGSGTLTVTGGALQAVGGDRAIANDVSVLSSFSIADSPDDSSLELAGDVNVVATSTITANNTDAFVISGDITGTGSAGLTKAGTGTMTLSGNNTYSGATTINEGTLQLQGGEAIRDNGAIVLANTAGAQLELLDDETVGTVSGGGTTGGDILLGDNRLTFGGATNTSFGGDVTGTGGLTYVGTGTFTVTSDLAFTGDLIIRSGTFASSGGIASDVVVEGGRFHALEASGDVTVKSGGTVNAGGSGTIETLEIGGNFTVQSGGTLEIDVNPTNVPGSRIDNVQVTGNATFENASQISFVANPTSLVEGTTQDFLSVDGTLSIDPKAVQVTDNVATLNARLQVDQAGQILRVLWTVEGVLQERARGENNRRIARAIERLPDSAERTAILNLTDADQLNSALDQRSPAPYFSAFMSNIMTAQTVNEKISHELRMAPLAARLAAADVMPEAPGATMFAAAANDPYVLGAAINHRRRNNDNFLTLDELSPIDPYRPQDMTSFFVSPFKVSQDHDTESDFVGYDAETHGLALGVRHPIREDVAVGLVFAYDRTNVNFKSNHGGSDIDTLRFGPLVSYRPVNQIWFIDAAATYGFHMFDTTRHITVPQAVTTEADYNAHDGTLYVDAGADFEFRGWLLTPMASLQYMHLFQEGFSESGGGPVADLTVDDQSFDSLISRIGVTISYPLDYASMIFIPEFALGWQHEFLADKQDVTANFAGGGSAFTIQTGIPNRDGIFYGAGVSVLLDDTKSLYIRYDALGSGNGDVSALSGGFVLRF